MITEQKAAEILTIFLGTKEAVDIAELAEAIKKGRDCLIHCSMEGINVPPMPK